MKSALAKPPLTRHSSGLRAAVQVPRPEPEKKELELELRDEDWEDDSVATLVDAQAAGPDGVMPSPLGDDEPLPLPFAQRYAQQAAKEYAARFDEEPEDDPPTRETPMALASALRAVATEMPVPGGELPRPAEELGPVPLVPPPPRMPSAVKDALPDDPLVPRYPSTPPVKQTFDSHIRPSPPRGPAAPVARPLPAAITPSGAFSVPPHPSSHPRVLSSPGVVSSSGIASSPAALPEPTPPPSRSGAFAPAPSSPSVSHARPFPSDTLRKVLLAYRPEMPPREWLYVIVPVSIAIGIAIGLAIVFVRIIHG